MTDAFEGDVATGQFAASSVGVKRSIGSVASSTIEDVPVIIVGRSQEAVVPIDLIAETQPPAESDIKTSSSVPQPPAVRPFVKKLKTKPEGVVTELIRQIIATQEGFHSRMSPYDKAMKIFEDRFSFGLTDHESMGFITLFADSPSAVQQFLSFTEHQRDLFVMRNKSKM